MTSPVPTLPASFAELDALPVRQRGAAFEWYVANLLRQAHFTVSIDSKVSAPRQTDVFALKLDEQYLVECKFRSRPVTIDDVDSLRSRLSRTKSSVVGLLVSRSGFTKEAIANVRYQRHQPILLLNADEIRTIEAHGPSSLAETLHRKKDALLREAQVLIDTPRPRHGPELPVPTPTRRFRTLSGEHSQVIDEPGGFDATVFTHELTNIDWAGPGYGVSLDVRLAVISEEEALAAFATLNDLGWVTSGGRWGIDQINRTWHGIGLPSLLQELPRWQPRKDHHSEQITYVDHCDGGFYVVGFVVDADETRRVTHMTLFFLLNGVPLDTSPIHHLCRSLGAHDALHLRPLGADNTLRYSVRQSRIGLTVDHQIVEPDFFETDRHEWVTGIVAANPFHRDHPSGFAKALPLEHAALAAPFQLICSLRHHHPVGEGPSEYVLDAIEYAWADDRIVCHPVADFIPTRRQHPEATAGSSEIHATPGS